MTQQAIRAHEVKAGKPRGVFARLGLVDYVLAGIVLAGVAFFIWRTSVVLDYNWNWSRVLVFIVKTDPKTGAIVPNLLLEGFFTTIRLAVYGIIIAAVIGTVMGLARTSNLLLLRLIGTAYVMLIRNIPPVVFVFVFVFFVASQIMPSLGLSAAVARLSPEAQGWLSIFFGTPRLIENFAVGLICLGVFSGAYVTEIVRAGIQSVPKSQLEAAQSIGLSKIDQFRFVVLPQAIRNVLPPLANQFIQLIKDSSLVSLVSIQELSFMAQDVQVATQRVFEVLLLVAGFYFVICYTLSLAFRRLESGMQKGR
ncbi:HisM ABC-type amino acid transport system, permease component [Rhabdaerophilaceae bacterium]